MNHRILRENSAYGDGFEPRRIRTTVYGKPHIYRSVWTWWNSMKTASYRTRLKALMMLDDDKWSPDEKDFIIGRIADILHNHADCIHGQPIPPRYRNLPKPGDSPTPRPGKRTAARPITRETPGKAPARINRMGDDEKAGRLEEIESMRNELCLCMHGSWGDDDYLQRCLSCLDSLWQEACWMYGETPADSRAAEVIEAVERDMLAARRRLLALSKR